MYSQIDRNKRRSIILVMIFVAVIILLGWIFGKITGYGYAGLWIAVIISIVMSLFSYYSGDKIALATSGAKEIKKTDNPYVYRMVENLCITAGLPMPKVHIISEPAINAFATGRDPEHASIAITQGAIDKLENEELEGVIAHELSHVKNYDIRLMMIVIVLIGIVVLMSDMLIRFQFFGHRRSRESNQIGAILLVVGIILAILSPIFAQLIQLAISRKREYLADASGALLTRYPDGLANALEKIGKQGQALKRANNATAHLYISNPFGKKKRLFANLFATHPPVEKRVAELRKMTI
ncbi:MAG: M48 family metallopeptidase [Patescibacteria group bacterium]|nr:M48 family metallopeptidase [Patescibacteria group bacterium]